MGHYNNCLRRFNLRATDVLIAKLSSLPGSFFAAFILNSSYVYNEVWIVGKERGQMLLLHEVAFVTDMR